MDRYNTFNNENNNQNTHLSWLISNKINMKSKITILLLSTLILIASLNAQEKTDSDAELVELPGDNLDLYATLDLFQKSKTIEEFEASLNDEKTRINNLDLNLDDEVDFIKVVTQKEGDDFAFVLQIDVLENEVQDVAIILVSKDKNDKIIIQMVGDEALYGKNYAIEPKAEVPPVTANPAYSGPDTVVVKSEPATVVVLESEPIVVYMYSPTYVPYYPPYYYGYYPLYYHPYPVVSVNLYFGRNRHHRNHYHGGHRGGSTVIINNNNNTYNNYNRTKNTSITVNKNKSEGNYKRNNNAKKPSTAPKNKPNSKPSTTPSNKPATKPNNKPQTKPSNKPTTKPSNKPAYRPKSGGMKKGRGKRR